MWRNGKSECKSSVPGFLLNNVVLKDDSCHLYDLCHLSNNYVLNLPIISEDIKQSWLILPNHLSRPLSTV